jgi:hypothetical protein
MARRALPVLALLVRVQKAAMAVQVAASQRRLATIGGSKGCAAWMPSVAELRLAFDGTSAGSGALLRITPGRPLFAWFMPSRVRAFEIHCDASDGWSPRLYIDGVPVDATG